jgi:heterotetrameric sarcosine oxidase beta subunit
MNVERERSGAVTIKWNGRRIEARLGDDVATALYAAGVRVFGHSRKFHRPLGLGGSFVAGVKAQVDGLANVRLDRLPVREGLVVESQNVWPDPRFDLLQCARLVPRSWLAGGFEHPNWLPSGTQRFQVWERLLRLAAGGGRAVAADRAGAAVAGERLAVDVAVVGGGPAGRSAAAAAASAGKSVVLISRGAAPGTFAQAMGTILPSLSPAVRALAGFEAAAIYRGGRLLIAAPHDGGCAKLIEPAKIILATGRGSVPPLVPGADLPGVLDLTTAVRLLGRCPLGNVCLIGTGDLAAVAARLIGTGTNIVRVSPANAVRAIHGGQQVRAMLLNDGKQVMCDTVVHAGSWRPDPALPFQAAATGEFRLSAGALPSGVELVGGAADSAEPVVFGSRLDDRAMVCPCMDVTVEEIRRHVDSGTTHVEELKRLTGCGMGPCQGFPCWDLLAATLSALTGREPDSFGHPSYRAPRGAFTIAQAAGLAGLVQPEKAATTVAADQRRPKKVAGAKAGVAIIGGGIQGLMLAFCLAERGIRGIRVFDAGYWQGGASGRNGTLVRPAFSSPEWTGLFSHSQRLWRGLSRRVGHNVMYSQRGYITLGESDRTAAICEQVVRVSRDCGVPTRVLSREELAQRLPTLDRNRAKAAVLFEEGGIVPHHAAMKGLRAACEARGVDICYQSQVTGIDRRGDRAIGLWLGDLRIAADCVVIAAGAHSPSVAALAGVELEGYPWRIEACALEPTRAIFDPAVAMLDRTVYMHQSARGEIVGGCEVPGDSSGLTVTSDLPVLAHYARHLVETMPCLADLRILRQWAGHIHASPDFGPLLGPHPDCRDLWISAGWSYGIAGAPAGGDLLAKAIATGKIDDRMAPFTVDRKRQGKLISEGAIVVSH